MGYPALRRARNGAPYRNEGDFRSVETIGRRNVPWDTGSKAANDNARQSGIPKVKRSGPVSLVQEGPYGLSQLGRDYLKARRLLSLTRLASRLLPELLADTAEWPFVNPRGWTYVGVCNGDGPHVGNAATGGYFSCATFELEAGFAYGINDPIPAFRLNMNRMAPYYPLPGTLRYHSIDQWNRPASNPGQAGPALAPIPVPIGRPMPVIDPLRQLPINRPAPAPAVLPMHRRAHRELPLPDGSVWEQRQVGNAVPRTVHEPRTGHAFARTGPGVKERKFIASPSNKYHVAARIFGHVTEVSDAVDALWDALPEAFRKRERAKRHGKAPGMLDKAQQIYDHFNEIDMTEAMANLAKNELQDRLIGKLGQKQAKATGELSRKGYYRSPVGLTTGPAL